MELVSAWGVGPRNRLTGPGELPRALAGAVGVAGTLGPSADTSASGALRPRGLGQPKPMRSE